MKITLVCNDVAYPAIHGGRVDMWRRIKAFSQFGIELQVVCWVNQTPEAQDILQIKKYVQHLCLIVYQRNVFSAIQQIYQLLKYPLEVTSRIVSVQLKSLVSEVDSFHPDLIWLDGIQGGAIALELSDKLDVPLIYRSHNIEYLYSERLFISATGMSKIKRFFSKMHMEKYERNILKKSALFYDISLEDLKFWQSQGFINGRYLPPLVDYSHSNNINVNSINEKSIEYDIVFCGNLYSNNNVAGIAWFLTDILPIVLNKLPATKVLIAGANPVEKVKKLCQRAGVHLKINPTSAVEIYNSGRIFINPTLTGSGVSIKSIEMLAFNKPIVSTLQGIAGLPEVVSKYFNIAEDAESFADAIVCLLSSNSQKILNSSTLLESMFGIHSIKNILQEITDFIELKNYQRADNLCNCSKVPTINVSLKNNI